MVQLDHDEELGPMHGSYGTLEAGLEVQRTIRRLLKKSYWSYDGSKGEMKCNEMYVLFFFRNPRLSTSVIIVDSPTASRHCSLRSHRCFFFEKAKSLVLLNLLLLTDLFKRS